MYAVHESELLVQPCRPYFRSNLEMEIYARGLSSSITISHENSSSISSVNFPMVYDDYGHDHDHMHDSSRVKMEGFDDVCRWLCDDDDDDQGMEEIDDGVLANELTDFLAPPLKQTLEERSIEDEDIWSPNFTNKSSEASLYVPPETRSEKDDGMETESQNGTNELLMAYAEAMEMEQQELAKVIVKCIIEKVNPIGPPLERIALALFQPQEETYLKQESSRNSNQAFRAFYDIFPYGRFAHFTASSTILQALPTHVDSIHIVDFDIGEGTQWPPVIEAVARRNKLLTITSIKLEENDSRFQETNRHLFNYARSLGLNLKVEEMELAQMVKGMESRKPSTEFVAFNCMVGLPHMGRRRSRTQVMDFLKIAKGFLAKTQGIITFGDGEEGERMRYSSNYTSFFNNHLAHYKALYESMEWGFPSYLNEARIAMETLFLAPFGSSVAWFEKWEERREDVRLGLKGVKMSNESLNEAKEMVKEGETPYRIRIEKENEMVLEWRRTPLVRVYAWR